MCLNLQVGLSSAWLPYLSSERQKELIAIVLLPHHHLLSLLSIFCVLLPFVHAAFFTLNHVIGMM